MGISIVTSGLLLLGAPAEPPSFAEIWYREVMLGDHAGASDDYQTLFLSPPSPKLEAETRRRAAFRAGLCFERLGHLEVARSAYASVPAPGMASGPLVEEALIRLKGLSSGEPPPEGSAAAPIDLAIAKELESHRAVKLEREAALARLSGEVSVRRARARERDDLLERLARLGLELVPPAGAPSLEAGPIRDVLAGAVREADTARVEAALGERLREAALLALIAGDRSRAGRHLEAAVSLQGRTALTAWCASIITADFPASAAAEAASRRLAEERFRRVVSLRRDVAASLASAEILATQRERPDLALVELEKVRERLERADRSIRSDPEARSLEARARRLLLGLGRGAGEERALSRLWTESREDLEAAVALAEELVILVRDGARFEGRLEAVRAAGGGRDSALAEAARLLAAAQVAAAAGNGEGKERALREADWIRRWVPAAVAEIMEVNGAPPTTGAASKK